MPMTLARAIAALDQGIFEDIIATQYADLASLPIRSVAGHGPRFAENRARYPGPRHRRGQCAGASFRVPLLAAATSYGMGLRQGDDAMEQAQATRNL
ncbi:hypothetical protein, partial [Novosphingobium lentum]|uniref:hypothetical protein n=1 Tax=Novosphingobium lentum TaxID=145287 RepID=UPI001C3F2F09